MAFAATPWADEPATTTPIDADNLLNLNAGIAEAKAAAAAAQATAAAAQAAVTALTTAAAPAGGPVPSAYAAANDPRFTTVPETKVTGSSNIGAALTGRMLDVDSVTDTTQTLQSTTTENWPAGAVVGLANINTGVVTLALASGVSVIPADGKMRLATQGATGRLRKLPGSSAAQPATLKLLDLNADTLTGAEGSAVTSWPDSSGNSLPAATPPAVANQPVLRLNSLNGHNTIAMDGGNDYFTLSGAMLALAQNRGQLMLSIVYVYPTAAATTKTLFSLSTGTSAAAVRAQLYHREPGAAALGAGARRLDTDAAGQFIAGGASTVGSTGEVLTACFDWGNRVLTIYKNGTQVATTTTLQTAGNTSNTPSLAGVIGANLAGTSEFFLGRYARIIAHGSVDPTLRLQLHTYLQAQYAIPMADVAGAADVWLKEGSFSA